MLIWIFLNTPHLLTHGKLLPFKMMSSPSEYRVAVVMMKTGAASCHTVCSLSERTTEENGLVFSLIVVQACGLRLP